jgi:hypothetical protein
MVIFINQSKTELLLIRVWATQQLSDGVLLFKRRLCWISLQGFKLQTNPESCDTVRRILDGKVYIKTDVSLHRAWDK